MSLKTIYLVNSSTGIIAGIRMGIIFFLFDKNSTLDQYFIIVTCCQTCFTIFFGSSVLDCLIKISKSDSFYNFCNNNLFVSLLIGLCIYLLNRNYNLNFVLLFSILLSLNDAFLSTILIYQDKLKIKFKIDFLDGLIGLLFIALILKEQHLIIYLPLTRFFILGCIKLKLIKLAKVIKVPYSFKMYVDSLAKLKYIIGHSLLQPMLNLIILHHVPFLTEGIFSIFKTIQQLSTKGLSLISKPFLTFLSVKLKNNEANVQRQSKNYIQKIILGTFITISITLVLLLLFTSNSYLYTILRSNVFSIICFNVFLINFAANTYITVNKKLLIASNLEYINLLSLILSILMVFIFCKVTSSKSILFLPLLMLIYTFSQTIFLVMYRKICHE